MHDCNAIEARLDEIKDELMVVTEAIKETKEVILSNQYEYTALTFREATLLAERQRLSEKLV